MEQDDDFECCPNESNALTRAYSASKMQINFDKGLRLVRTIRSPFFLKNENAIYARRRDIGMRRLTRPPYQPSTGIKPIPYRSGC